MIEKFIIDKFKKILGSQYVLCDNDFFDRNYTTVLPANGQYTQLINYDAFEKLGNKILGVVQVQSAQYAVTSFAALNSTYSLTLWVPLNYKFVTANGEQIRPDKFNVDLDIKNVRESLNNQTIDFGDGYKGEMTFSEPTPAGGGIENSGSYKRKILIVTGKINLTTKGYYGRDYKLEIGRLNDEDEVEYLTVKDITSLSFNPQPSTIENHEQGKIIPEETVEAVKQGCVFSVNDDCSNDNLNELLTSLALNGEVSQQAFWLKISKQKSGSYVQIVDFPVIITVSLSYPYGDSDVGTFTVTCIRKEE